MPNFSHLRDELIVSGEASCLDSNTLTGGLRVNHHVNKSIVSSQGSNENRPAKLKDRNLIRNSKIQG